jgi:3-oxo-5alpha-steroid 4-dehydrogenase
MAPRSTVQLADAARQIEKLEAAHSRPLTVKVRKGVVLATGGYAFSSELLREFTPEIVQGATVFHKLATLGNDGQGIELGRSVGGAVNRMKSLYIARHIVPAALTTGLLVNNAGGRFVAEDAYISVIGDAIRQQDRGVAWLIVNGPTLRKSFREVFGSGWTLFRYYAIRFLPNFLLGGTRRAGGLDALAKSLKLPLDQFLSTVARHDADIEAGVADGLGKSSEARAPLGSGPYYAINMCFANRHALTLLMTLGGLRVDEEDGAVLREDASKVEGLFAAGNCAGGLHSNGYISGLAIADCVFAGRRAGRSAAGQRMPEAGASRVVKFRQKA